MSRRYELPDRLIPRLVLYIGGLLMTSTAVLCFVKSNLGVSPVVSVPYVLSRVFPITQGQAVMIVFSLFVLLQWPILGKAFRLVTFLQLIAAILFGYLNDFVYLLFPITTPATYLGRLSLLGLGLILFAVGIIIYMKAGLFLLPVEGIQQAIVLSYKIPFSVVKTSFDLSMVVVSLLIGYLIMGQVIGVREGTLLAGILVGPLIHLFHHWFAPLWQMIDHWVAGK